MLDVYFAIAAGRVIVDTRTNQISIIDVYEKLESNTFPVYLPKLALLFYLSRDKGDPATRDLTMICTVDETEIFQVDVHVDFKDSDTNRIVLDVEGVNIPKTGTLKAYILDGDRPLGVLDLQVEKRA